MSISINKIIDFEPHHQKAHPEAHRKENAIIDECWSVISQQLDQLMPVFFSRLDDNLFRMSERSDTDAMATQFFEAMRYLRTERNELESHYRKALHEIYKEYWSEEDLSKSDKEESTESSEDRDFDLMEDSVLEESLAVYGMIEKGNNLYQLELFSLAQRFCTLLGEEREVRILPVSPYAICKEFENLLQSLTLDLKVKIFIYKVFDRQILSNLGQMYQELNSHLVANGVLPSIARHLKRHGPSEPHQTSLRLQAEIEETKEALAYLDVFRSMQSLMEAWRNKSPSNDELDFAQEQTKPVNSEDVLGALHSLQFSSEEEIDSHEAITPERLKQYITLQIAKLKGDNETRVLSRNEEDIIDMVGIIFDYILDDKGIALQIKCPIARLQIPIIKVAILDKSFFSKKSHPARALLNALAQAGVGLGSGDVVEETQIIRKAEMIVGRVIHEFDKDVELFSELLKELTEFLDKDLQRAQINEDRTRKVTQSKEKVWTAKKKVAYEITRRLQGKDTPASIKTFLYNEWKDVLVLAYLQQEKIPGEWEQILQITDQILWSIVPAANADERKQVIQAIPMLIKSINHGLESISLDAHQIGVLLGDLEACHLKALRLSTVSSSMHPSERPPDNHEPFVDEEVVIHDEEMIDALSEIDAELPDIAGLEVEEVVVGGLGGQAEIPFEDQKPDYAMGVYREWVNRLNEGDWVEFQTEDEKHPVIRAKLSCKSSTMSLCVFVNRRGVKVLELKTQELASRMREGKAKVLEDYKTPMMDRALTFLMHSLRKPFVPIPQASESKA